MELTKLFEVQRILDAEIGQKHPRKPGEDRLEKRVLALLVELGECANEWRGFKFWSLNQKPNDSSYCSNCAGNGFTRYEEVGHILIPANNHSHCESCNGFGYKNPLLEEYVDCLHFALSIGLQLNIPMNLEWEAYRLKNINEQFISLFQSDWATYYTNVYHGYCRNMELLIGLGEMLGFTWEQIEEAYMSKNKINHERQANGY